MRVTQHLLQGLGCACAPRGLGNQAPWVDGRVYLFYLDTKNFTSSPGGPYSYMSVPYAYYGKSQIPMPNAPPDAVVLDKANAGAAAGAIQVLWYSDIVMPGQLQQTINPGTSGTSSPDPNNLILSGSPPADVIPQAGVLASSIGGPILVGVIPQSTTARAFQQHLSPVGSSVVAPVIAQTSQSLNVSAPQATSVVQRQTGGNYDESSLVVGTQNPPGGSTVTGDDGLSFWEIAIILGLGAALLL